MRTVYGAYPNVCAGGRYVGQCADEGDDETGTEEVQKGSDERRVPGNTVWRC